MSEVDHVGGWPYTHIYTYTQYIYNIHTYIHTYICYICYINPMRSSGPGLQHQLHGATQRWPGCLSLRHGPHQRTPGAGGEPRLLRVRWRWAQGAENMGISWESPGDIVGYSSVYIYITYYIHIHIRIIYIYIYVLYIKYHWALYQAYYYIIDDCTSLNQQATWRIIPRIVTG
jgi:hypothetical protein